VTDSGSFKEVPFWYEELRKHNRSCRVILVGNKSDLESERQVSYERAVQFTKDRLESCMYIETSCRDGSGVIEAFLQAAEIGSKQVNTPGGF
jgi:GTPase SAR1 family protein